MPKNMSQQSENCLAQNDNVICPPTICSSFLTLSTGSERACVAMGDIGYEKPREMLDLG